MLRFTVACFRTQYDTTRLTSKRFIKYILLHPKKKTSNNCTKCNDIGNKSLVSDKTENISKMFSFMIWMNKVMKHTVLQHMNLKRSEITLEIITVRPTHVTRSKDRYKLSTNIRDLKSALKTILDQFSNLSLLYVIISKTSQRSSFPEAAHRWLVSVEDKLLSFFQFRFPYPFSATTASAIEHIK